MLAGLICLANCLPAAHAAPAAKLDSESCLKCHESKHDKIKVPVLIDGEEEERDLRQLDTRKFAKSVHSKLQCVDCHQNIVDSQKNHQIDKNAPQTSCAGCHQALWDKAQKDGSAKDKPRLDVVARKSSGMPGSRYMMSKPSLTRYDRLIGNFLVRLCACSNIGKKTEAIHSISCEFVAYCSCCWT